MRPRELVGVAQAVALLEGKHRLRINRPAFEELHVHVEGLVGGGSGRLERAERSDVEVGPGRYDLLVERGARLDDLGEEVLVAKRAIGREQEVEPEREHDRPDGTRSDKRDVLRIASTVAWESTMLIPAIRPP